MGCGAREGNCGSYTCTGRRQLGLSESPAGPVCEPARGPRAQTECWAGCGRPEACDM